MRVNGYYWTKINDGLLNTHYWNIRKFANGFWVLPEDWCLRSDECTDYLFDEINEERILNPDEVKK